MKIQLQITDDASGKDVLITVNPHNAQKLYRALGEIFGDMQYGAKPGQLVTLPDARIKLTSGLGG